jgi:hypothetical protein
MNWKQIWANYYSHVTRDMTVDETHGVLLKERDCHALDIRRAEEHLAGITLFYEQSTYVDPAKPADD